MPPLPTLIVGTFKTPLLHTLTFNPTTSPASLTLTQTSPAIGPHSFLALSPSKQHLYATAWTTPPSTVAYAILPDGRVDLINSAPVRSRNGYVACDEGYIYSVSGPGGEVFERRAGDGGVGRLVQEISFVEEEVAAAAAAAAAASGNGSSNGDGGDSKANAEPKHGDFGGLRHGGHSGDLSPDGKALYVADIGRNCVWTYAVDSSSAGKRDHLTLGEKHAALRHNDGPRHTTPHPNGRVLYVLNEHSSTVDAFSLSADGLMLKDAHSVKIIPEQNDARLYWADEVRVSKSLLYDSGSKAPRFLYASTRGLEVGTKGCVAVFALSEEGRMDECVYMYETATSGGWANAVEPAPEGCGGVEGVEFVALTDSEAGCVFMLAFDGRVVREVARVGVEEAATAVWL